VTSPLLTLAAAVGVTLTVAGGTAPTWKVGPDQTGANAFASPRLLFSSGKMKAGDTVQIDACTYTDDYVNDGPAIAVAVSITAVASSSPHCVITDPWQGKNPSRPPMAVIAQSPPCADTTQACHWGVAKGLWRVTGAGVTINRIAFLGAYNAPGDTNGAGIRIEGAGTTTISNSYFRGNQNGILGGVAGGTVVLDHTEFEDNGQGGCFDSCTHQVYLGGAKVTITDSYFHDLNVSNKFPGSGNGNQIKSRANATTIARTRVFDNQSPASYEIDIPQGGTISVTDSVIEQGSKTEQSIIMDTGENGGDGAMNASSGMDVSRNIFVNDLTGGALAIHNGSTTAVTGSGNSFYGLTAGQVSNGFTVSLTGSVFPTTRPTLDTSSPIR
jgi:hypothetical protein